ncbi:hypothetical protein VCRA2119O48_220051 [Vibrio crassostreae]|nr:hypothetical protein VCRA2119O48_220051 [Vibrio crassostreae]CAK3849540.1 hypothetical protein VCRA212O16_230052 [Vibrio crassostreae]
MSPIKVWVGVVSTCLYTNVDGISVKSNVAVVMTSGVTGPSTTDPLLRVSAESERSLSSDK